MGKKTQCLINKDHVNHKAFKLVLIMIKTIKAKMPDIQNNALFRKCPLS